jgi:carbonic anhydrase
MHPVCPARTTVVCGPNIEAGGGERRSRAPGLDAAYAACVGTRQSPVDLAANDEAQEVAIQIDYTTAGGTLVDTGHGVRVNVEGGTITIDGQAFSLRQFHFHTPSEHVLGGQSYPAEAHLVHVSEDGDPQRQQPSRTAAQRA